MLGSNCSGRKMRRQRGFPPDARGATSPWGQLGRLEVQSVSSQPREGCSIHHTWGGGCRQLTAAKGQRKAWSPRGALARAETEACGCGVGESHQRHKKENAGWPRTRHRTRCPLEAPDAVRPVCVAEPRPQGPRLSWGGRISACCRQGEPRRDALAPSTSSAWWT